MIIFHKNKLFNTKYLKLVFRQKSMVAQKEEYGLCGKFDDGQEALLIDGLCKSEAERMLLEIADNFTDDNCVHYGEVL